jgi:hypothetical protein
MPVASVAIPRMHRNKQERVPNGVSRITFSFRSELQVQKTLRNAQKGAKS